MPNTGTLRLPQSPRAAVFRAIVGQLRADADLQPRIRTWRVWDGNQSDTLPWAAAMSPGIRITPIGEAATLYTPSAHRAPLLMQVEMCVASIHGDDVENLWWAMFRAIHPLPHETGHAAVQVRRDAGAETGIVSFSALSYEFPPDVNPPILIGLFTMSCDVALTRTT